MIEDEDIEIEDTQREDRHDLMMRLLMWREKHINEHNFVLILSFIIGICTAAAALILKFLIHFIQQLLTSHFNADSANYLYLIYPIIGILLAGLYVRYIVKDDISHGVTRILYAISQKKSRLKPHNMYTSVIASSITIGFGGSVGAEAPIVYTGAAIGSNIGRLFRLDQRLLMLLVGCGAAAAVTVKLYRLTTLPLSKGQGGFFARKKEALPRMGSAQAGEWNERCHDGQHLPP